MPNPKLGRRGQTLVEALVALSILTAGMFGILTLLTKSFQLNRSAANQAQGAYLAAEGIEVAKNLIDHDVNEVIAKTGGYSWGSCFRNSGYYYNIDYRTADCSPSKLKFNNSGKRGTPLYYDPASGLYSDDSSLGKATDFTRFIHIQYSADGEEVDVRSEVDWTLGLGADSVVLEDKFYNWHPTVN